MLVDPLVCGLNHGLNLAFNLFAHAVIWTKENPTPWNDIKPNEGTKLLTVNQHFDKSYVYALLCFFVPLPFIRWERKKL